MSGDNPVQMTLFDVDSPLPGNAQAQARQDEQLLQDGYDFLLKHVRSRQDTAAEVVAALVERFGYGIRGVVIDLVRQLQDETTLQRIDRDYVRTALTEKQFIAALQRKETKRSVEQSTLDELFGRSLEHRGSSRFVEAVNFVAKLREYAPYNNMLVYLQRPNATFWATTTDWHRRFKRWIKEDAIPIIMLQPMGPVMLVYDVSDTDGPPLPEHFSKAFEATGKFDDAWLAKTLDNCERAQIKVKRKRLGMLHAGTAIRSAYTSGYKLSIELNEDLPSPAQYATLCHELAHLFLGHLGNDEDRFWPSRLGLRRAQRELEAEAVAFLVCRRAGLVTSSAEYLAGYLANPEDLHGVSVDMIMKVAGQVERMGRETVRFRSKRRGSQESDDGVDLDV